LTNQIKKNLDVIKEIIGPDNGVGFSGRYAVTGELHEGVLKSVPILEGSPVFVSVSGFRCQTTKMLTLKPETC
jgi:hypothetical protein